MLSGRSQSHKTAYYVIPFLWNVYKRQIHKEQIGGYQGLREGGKWGVGFLLGLMQMFWDQIMVMVAQLCKHS